MTATDPVDLVFDTFAWLEELGHGPFGERVHALHVAKRIGTPVVALAELAHIHELRHPQSRETAIETVMGTSTVLPLTAAIAVAAGRTRAQLAASRRGIGLIDCIILETARAHGARLLTGDPHLKGLDDVDFLA